MGTLSVQATVLPYSDYWDGLTYGNGTFIALVNSAARSATSTDGITWVARTMPSAATWTSVCWDVINSQFLAVSQDGGINGGATSPDGVTWTAITIPAASATWTSITHNGSFYLLVGNGETNTYTSTDGVSWTAHSQGGTYGYTSVAWNGAIFLAARVAVSPYMTPFATSSDGVTWTDIITAFAFPARDVAWNGTVFVAGSDNAGQIASVAVSTDGASWAYSTLTTSRWLRAAAASSVLVVASFNSNLLAYSYDNGASWTETTATTTGAWSEAAGYLGGVVLIPSGPSSVGNFGATSISINFWESLHSAYQV